MVVRELLAKLGFKVDDKNLSRWNKRTDQAKRLMKDAARGAKQFAKATAIVATGAAVAATAMFKLVKSSADVGDQAAKDARKLGLSAESVQELGFAAKLAGADFGTVKIGLQAFTRGLNDAITKGTGPAAEAFEQLGISIDDPILKTKDLDKILPMLADKFAAMPNDADKTALSMKLFSRSGAELIPLLNEGSAGIAAMRQEARELGNVMSNEQAAASEQFNDDLERLMSTLSGVRNVLAGELMPIANEWINDLREWIGENRELIAQRVREFLLGLVNVGKSLLPVVVNLAGALSKLVDVMGPEGLAAAFIAVKVASGGLGGILMGVATAAAFAGFKIAEAMESAESKIKRVQQLQRNQEAAEEVRKLKEGNRKIEKATEIANQLFDREVISEADVQRTLAALDAAPDSQPIRSLREAVIGERARVPIAETTTAKKPKKPRGGGRGRKAGPSKRKDDLSIEDMLERDFGANAGGALGPSATKPSLGTTINRFDYSPRLDQKIEVTQRDGESPTDFASRIVEITREVLEQQNRQAADHFRGALG